MDKCYVVTEQGGVIIKEINFYKTENDLNYVVRNRAGNFEILLVKVKRKNDKYSIVSSYSTNELEKLGIEKNNYVKTISIYDELILNPDLSKYKNE